MRTYQSGYKSYLISGETLIKREKRLDKVLDMLHIYVDHRMVSYLSTMKSEWYLFIVNVTLNIARNVIRHTIWGNFRKLLSWGGAMGGCGSCRVWVKRYRQNGSVTFLLLTFSPLLNSILLFFLFFHAFIFLFFHSFILLVLSFFHSFFHSFILSFIHSFILATFNVRCYK